MTTKKKTDGRIKSTVKKAKENLEGTNPTITAGFCQPEYTMTAGFREPEYVNSEKTTGGMTTTDTDIPEPQTYEFCWNDSKADEKRELAKDILIRLIDFNLEQLSRKDVDKVLIYDNPAEYAAEVVNELYEKVDDGK